MPGMGDTNFDRVSPEVILYDNLIILWRELAESDYLR